MLKNDEQWNDRTMHQSKLGCRLFDFSMKSMNIEAKKKRKLKHEMQRTLRKKQKQNKNLGLRKREDEPYQNLLNLANESAFKYHDNESSSQHETASSNNECNIIHQGIN